MIFKILLALASVAAVGAFLGLVLWVCWFTILWVIEVINDAFQSDEEDVGGPL